MGSTYFYTCFMFITDNLITQITLISALSTLKAFPITQKQGNHLGCSWNIFIWKFSVLNKIARTLLSLLGFVLE